MTQPQSAPAIHGAPVLGVRPGTPLLFRIAATGEAPLSFQATGLPQGLSLAADTGIITGSVASAGEYAIELQATNPLGSAARTLTLVVGDTLALTPPMGWNSYDSFDDSVNEAEFLAQASWLREHLQPFGWDTVVLDFRWYDPDAPGSNQVSANPQLAIDANGRLQPAPNRFPSAAGGVGFKSIADQVHAMGLKFGIHIMRGIPRLAVAANAAIAGSAYSAEDAVREGDDNGYTCVWNADMYGVKGDTPAGQAWYDSIFAQYAAWGVDFVKVDDATKNRPVNLVEYHQSEVEAIQNAIHASGRSMLLSLSPGESLTSATAHLESHANMWRMSDDFWDRWEHLQHTFTLAERWASAGGSGHWPDADMLPLGHLGPRCPVDGANRSTRFTRNEQVLMLTLWALLPSPYMLGANMLESAGDAFFLALLQNEEVLAVHQDALGKKAQLLRGDESQAIWVRELAGGGVAIGLFNRGDLDRPLSISLAELQLTERRLVRNAWSRAELSPLEAGGSVELMVPSHAAALLVLSPEAPEPPATGGAGGSPSSGGTAGTGSGLGGAPGSAGATMGAAGSSAGAGGVSVAGAAAASPSPTAERGCACSLPSSSPQPAVASLAALALLCLTSARLLANTRRRPPGGRQSA